MYLEKDKKKQDNIFKFKMLKSGLYILLLQVEGPDQKESEKKTRNLDIDITLSIYSDTLIHIETLPEPDNFLRNLYEHYIFSTELEYLKGKDESK